jgi:hypothetical protein
MVRVRAGDIPGRALLFLEFIAMNETPVSESPISGLDEGNPAMRAHLYVNRVGEGFSTGK